MIELIVGFAIGLVLMFLILWPRLKKQNFINEQIREEKSKILEETQQAKSKLKALENESWELATEIANSRSELMEIKVETARCRSQKEELLVNIEEMKASADSTANAIYEKSLLEMSINLDQSADNMRQKFQQAEEDCQQEYLSVLKDLSSSVSTEMQEKKEQLAQARLVLDELAQKITAAVAASKRQAEIKEKANFYKINIPEADLNEIKKLREIIPYLKDQEALNKVIWKVYYEKPVSDLIGRVVGANKITGIYKITDITNDKCYVGQCVNMAERWRQHIKRGLGAEPPTRNKLYPAMAEKGLENFTFELIEECDASLLDEREDFWQDYFHAKDYGYSIK